MRTETKDRLGGLIRAVERSPLLAVALFPPWGFIPSVRQYVSDRIAEEELVDKLRAVIGPLHIDEQIEIVDYLVEESRKLAPRTQWPAITRRQALEWLYAGAITGEPYAMDDAAGFLIIYELRNRRDAW